jgi:hypothetical protein
MISLLANLVAFFGALRWFSFFLCRATILTSKGKIFWMGEMARPNFKHREFLLPPRTLLLALVCVSNLSHRDGKNMIISLEL